MKRRSNNLNQAKSKKNDEFYTKISDIEKELSNYRDHFKNKVVFCNCDDPSYSDFIRYFALNFEFLELKKLFCTHYESDKPSYWIEINHKVNNIEEIDNIPKFLLKENGDFRSPECIEFLKKSDIVCTNPPFSLFRKYIAQLVEYEKKFLVIGSYNAVTYKDVFPLIKENKIWFGFNFVKEFNTDENKIQKFGNITWYTNLTHKKQNDKLFLYKNYYENENNYPKYDNYNAIEVSKVVNIPKDYEGVMGVPVTFLDKYNPDQFKILGIDLYMEDNPDYGNRFTIDGRTKYARILIKKL